MGGSQQWLALQRLLVLQSRSEELQTKRLYPPTHKEYQGEGMCGVYTTACGSVLPVRSRKGTCFETTTQLENASHATPHTASSLTGPNWSLSLPTLRVWVGGMCKRGGMSHTGNLPSIGRHLYGEAVLIWVRVSV